MLCGHRQLSHPAFAAAIANWQSDRLRGDGGRICFRRCRVRVGAVGERPAMMTNPDSSARKVSGAAERLTVSIRFAISALVLPAILLTALASSLLWWRTSEAISRQLASTINEQIASAVRK